MLMTESGESLLKELENVMETLKRHISIIKILTNEQPVGIIRLSRETGLPEHKVRYSLRVLERDNVIEPSTNGAILSPEFIENRPAILNRVKKLSDELAEIYHDLEKLLSG
jgi:predicted transcriptional regulator